MENKQVVIVVNGIEECVCVGSCLHEILQERNMVFMPCAGHGRCGKCKILASGILSEPNEKERAYLTKQELEKGVRLACQAKVLGECYISTIQEGTMEVVLNEPFVSKATEGIPLTEKMVPETRIEMSFTRESMSSIEKVEAPKRMFETLGAAVDIGTTTLAVSLYNEQGLVGKQGAINPQITFGADVISRMEQSLNGKSEQLANAVQREIVNLLEQLCQKYGYCTEHIVYIDFCKNVDASCA